MVTGGKRINPRPEAYNIYRMSIEKTSNVKTDWSKCCLCQTDKTGEDLSSPIPGRSKSDGYSMLATNIPLFQELCQMPMIINPARLDEGDGIEDTLRQNNAQYHQSCRALFKNTKLDRARKRASDAQEHTDKSCSKTRRVSLKPEQCFICDKEFLDDGQRREVMTMGLSSRLNECATTLGECKILARLSAGDAIAQEFKYHKDCLTTLYNRERCHLAALQKQENEDSQKKGIHPLVYSELLAYIVETNTNSDAPVVFKLADLITLYKQRLEQLELHELASYVHSTRLKEKLLSDIPALEAHKSGRDVILSFTEDAGSILSKASEFSDAVILNKAASILRRHMLAHEWKFNGRFRADSVGNSIPQSLQQFVCMVEHGVDIKSQLELGSSKTDLAVAQLLQYNCYRHKSNSSTFRHSHNRETPFPIFMGLSLYGKTRKRGLVELLHDHGLSISYDRVLEISAQLGDAVVDRYTEEGVVCPTELRKGLFTTSAMDNIDHNPSATTATTSFHGTSISLFQHPTSDSDGELREPLMIKNHSIKRVPELPESFTNIHPAYLKNKTPSPPEFEYPTSVDIDFPRLLLANEFQWLEKVHLTQSIDDDVNITWSAHHASEKRGLDFKVSITSILPLLREQAHTVATIRHVMERIRETIAFLNPGQIPVITADQPLYALTKQIQWHWPQQYGENKFVIMFGGLHVEMAALKSIGSLLKASGWIEAIVEADIASSGIAESFITASSVTRTRYAHQITACSLYTLMKKAYEYYIADTSLEQDASVILSFDEWCEKRKAESPQFSYWYLVLSMELTILSLIRSFREADFRLYVETLMELIPYFFANNNYNYARWLSVHLKDMLCLEQTHPDTHLQFKNGKFVVFKSLRPFSSMAIDQAHEQENAIIKGEGGVVGVTEDPSALRRWMVAGPEVSRLTEEYEALSSNKDVTENMKHREQTSQSQKAFYGKVTKLTAVINEMGNPFQEESSDLLTLDTKIIASETAAEAVRMHYGNGRTRFKEFMKTLEGENRAAFYSKIKRNNIDFFDQTKQAAVTDAKHKSLKDDCRLFSKLFISCQSRECDLMEFFKHENQSFPASLSENGNLYSGTKSQLALLLQSKVTCPDSVPHVSVIIIDGSALVNTIPPCKSKTFEEYAQLDFFPKVLKFSSAYERTDIVFDVYLPTSLKAETRTKRGQGAKRRVTHNGKLPPNWRNFLRDDDNKTALFKFLADRITSLAQDHENLVVITRVADVVSNQNISFEGLAPCNHEESDTRMFVHAKHAVNHGYKTVLLKANDTDVLVIAITVFPVLKELGLEAMFIEFGQGNDTRFIPVHEVISVLGPEKAKGLSFFHAFTGCDNVSAFRYKAKKTAFQTWNVLPDVTDVFVKLSSHPPVITSEDQAVIDQFVITMYDRSTSLTEIDAVRLDMFARKQRPYDSIPPTKAALTEHTKRATYQAGCIWSQATCCHMEIDSPGEWGWKKHGNTWKIFWTTLPPVAESCKELTKCGCKTQCFGRCKCYKFGLPCTNLCSCNCEC